MKREPKFQLGQKINFEAVLKRHFKYTPSPNGVGRINQKVWQKYKHPNGSGIIIGIRTLSDGQVDYCFDEPAVYKPEKYFKALLVVENLRNKPVLIPYPAIGIEAAPNDSEV